MSDASDIKAELLVLKAENAKLRELEERIRELELRLDTMGHFMTVMFELHSKRIERIEELLDHKGGDA